MKLIKIAADLGCSQSIISGEVRCNHQQANHLTLKRHTDKAKSTKVTAEITDIIYGYISLGMAF
jgi:hypothetical protein